MYKVSDSNTEDRLKKARALSLGDPAVVLLMKHGLEDAAKVLCEHLARDLWDCGTSIGWSEVYAEMLAVHRVDPDGNLGSLVENTIWCNGCFQAHARDFSDCCVTPSWHEDLYTGPGCEGNDSFETTDVVFDTETGDVNPSLSWDDWHEDEDYSKYRRVYVKRVSEDC